MVACNLGESAASDLAGKRLFNCNIARMLGKVQGRIERLSTQVISSSSVASNGSQTAASATSRQSGR